MNRNKKEKRKKNSLLIWISEEIKEINKLYDKYVFTLLNF